jgi:hypothetical protein
MATFPIESSKVDIPAVVVALQRGKEGNEVAFIRASKAVRHLCRAVDGVKVMEPERILLGRKGAPALLVAGLQRHMRS